MRFHPDNIIIGSRHANIIAIIDKNAGKIVWRLGPDYPRSASGPRKLPAPVNQLSGQHDLQIIPEGLPGAGNLLVFDDQGEAGYPQAKLNFTGGSRILEIDPVKKKIVWEYRASETRRPEWTFYSSFIVNVRRLPNGNTFIDEGMNGRFFQVTPTGEIAGEYVSPYFGEAPLGPGGKKVVTNWVDGERPVLYDWVPAGTPNDEHAVLSADLSKFQLPAQR